MSGTAQNGHHKTPRTNSHKTSSARTRSQSTTQQQHTQTYTHNTIESHLRSKIYTQRTHSKKKPTPLIGETFRQNQFSGDFLTKHRQSSRLLVTTVTHQRYIMDMFSLWCSVRFIGQVLLDGSRNTMQHCSTHLTLRHLCRQPSMI